MVKLLYKCSAVIILNDRLESRNKRFNNCRVWHPTRMKEKMQMIVGLLHHSDIFLSPLILLISMRTIQWMIMGQKERRKRTQPILIAGNALPQVYTLTCSMQ
jgi:hypothetical protein